MISVRVKKLFEPIVLQKAKDFSLFYLKVFWETDLWVTLGDFTQNWERKSLFNLKNELGRNEMWCAEKKNHSYMCHLCAKNFGFES